MAIAGKVAITLSTENGGAWSANVTYDRLVAVKHNNNLYISRKTVANVEPPNDEFWFPALEGFSGDDIEKIISGETVVGNASLLSGLTAEQVGESGARNLIPYPYYETTHTDKGITWTDNGDGTVTANGTATALSQFYLCIDNNLGLEPDKTYYLSGCPSGGTSSTYQLRAIMNFQKESPQTAADKGNGVTFTTNDSYSVIRIMIDIFEGTTVNNLTFRPMLELGSVAHDFTPYHFGGAEKAKEADNAKTLDGHGAEYFAKEADLANYLPLDGSVALKRSVTVGDGSTGTKTVAFDNSKRDFRLELLEDGTFRLRDVTGNATVLQSLLNGTATFNGTAENANYLSVYGGNEINFKGFTGGTGLFFNYRNADTGGANTKALDWFRFGTGLDNGTDAIRLDMTKGSGTLRDILHTGNKPTGTYTGNGDATERTINIGGIGSTLTLMAGLGLYHLTVGNSGAYGYAGDSKMPISLPGEEINFRNGILTIASTSIYVNGNAYQYHWEL